MRNRLGLLVGLLLLPAAASAGVELTLAAGPRWGEPSLLIEARAPRSFIDCVTTPCFLAQGRTCGGARDAVAAQTPGPQEELGVFL